MLLMLAQWLQEDFGSFRVFNYITFRAVLATLTALLIGLVCGPWVIRKLSALKMGQAVRKSLYYDPQPEDGNNSNVSFSKRVRQKN